MEAASLEVRLCENSDAAHRHGESARFSVATNDNAWMTWILMDGHFENVIS